MEPGFTVVVDEGARFVRVVVHGSVTVDMARRFAVEAKHVARQRGLNCFLFDVSAAPNVSSAGENDAFVRRDTSEMHLAQNARAAILVAPQDRSHDFIEIAMANAGYFVKMFTDEAAAVRWLEEPPS